MIDDFDQAVEYVNKMKDELDVSVEVQEDLYGLYKRVTIGKCSEKGGARPPFINLIARRKYDAWNRYDKLNDEECRKKYLTIVNRFSL